MTNCAHVGRCCRTTHNKIDCGASEWGCRLLKLQAWGIQYRDIRRATGIPLGTLSAMRNDPAFEPYYSTGIAFRRYFVRVAVTRRRAAEQQTA